MKKELDGKGIRTVRLNEENHKKLKKAKELIVINGLSGLRKLGVGAEAKDFNLGTICGIALELLIKELEQK